MKIRKARARKARALRTTTPRPTVRRCPDCGAEPPYLSNTYHHETDCPQRLAVMRAEAGDRAWLDAHPGRPLVRTAAESEQRELTARYGAGRIVSVRVQRSRWGVVTRLYEIAGGRAYEVDGGLPA